MIKPKKGKIGVHLVISSQGAEKTPGVRVMYLKDLGTVDNIFFTCSWHFNFIFLIGVYFTTAAVYTCEKLGVGSPRHSGKVGNHIYEHVGKNSAQVAEN